MVKGRKDANLSGSTRYIIVVKVSGPRIEMGFIYRIDVLAFTKDIDASNIVLAEREIFLIEDGNDIVEVCLNVDRNSRTEPSGALYDQIMFNTDDLLIYRVMNLKVINEPSSSH
eukprot:TRINITY_DN1672_c0_g1_i8.p1 TRINITY_DN1672_c0_g1~~TRINITY_DN1672_c0_g1_i8.p1  ORF type:complete len:114 (-),score=13.82 TRINITY_DN1672_c0_g1_i8:605-946(-)